MKKIMIVVAGLMFLVAADVSHARLLKKDVVKGTVVGIDFAKNEIAVTDFRSGATTVYIVSPGVVNTLQKGNVVIVMADIGSRYAKSVRVVTPRVPRAVAAAPAPVSRPTAPAAQATRPAPAPVSQATRPASATTPARNP